MWRRQARQGSWRPSGGRAGKWWRAAERSTTLERGPPAPALISRRAPRVLSSPWWPWIRRSSLRRRCGAAAASAATLGLLACLYRFTGGGLPNVKTVAIVPFDNDTPEPALTREVNDAVREALENRLGLRLAGEQTADAVVRGRIARYEPDDPTPSSAAASPVTNRMCRSPCNRASGP